MPRNRPGDDRAQRSCRESVMMRILNNCGVIRMLKKIFALGILSLGLVSVAYAGDDTAKKEMSTAVMHAEFSAKSKEIAGVHLHLHHVVNCLVGEHGKQFDASAGDPCKGMGDGAINDAQNQYLKKTLQKVLAEAEQGLATTDPDKGRMAATNVHKMLKGALGE